MKCPGNEFLAGSAFPLDQNTHIGFCHLFNEVFDSLQLGTVVHEFAAKLIDPQLLLQALYYFSGTDTCKGMGCWPGEKDRNG